jgi:hypothetical protein
MKMQSAKELDTRQVGYILAVATSHRMTLHVVASKKS